MKHFKTHFTPVLIDSKTIGFLLPHARGVDAYDTTGRRLATYSTPNAAMKSAARAGER